jgi:hypothetical protein
LQVKFNQIGGQKCGNHNNFQKNTSDGAYCTYYCRPGHNKINCFKLKKIDRNSGTSNNDGQGHTKIVSNDVAFTTITMKNNFQVTCGFLIVEQVVITANPWKCERMLSKLMNQSRLETVIQSKQLKMENLKFEVTRINGEKFKVVPNLCVNLFSLNKALKKGFKVSNNGVFVSLNYNHVNLTLTL